MVHLGSLGPMWIKSACKHPDPVPVDVTDPVTGDVLLVARLCPDCDTQLETGWTRDVIPEPNGFECWAYAPDHPAGTQETARLALKDSRPDRSGGIPEGYRVNPSSKDPYEDLIFVGGSAINKQARRPFPDRVWDRCLTTWDGMKTGVRAALDLFFRTFCFMWSIYLIGLISILGGMHR